MNRKRSFIVLLQKATALPCREKHDMFFAKELLISGVGAVLRVRGESVLTTKGPNITIGEGKQWRAKLVHSSG